MLLCFLNFTYCSKNKIRMILNNKQSSKKYVLLKYPAKFDYKTVLLSFSY